MSDGVSDRQHLGRRAAAERRAAADRAARAPLGTGRGHPWRHRPGGREELSDWAEELSESELRALRDPRNWVRPVVAVSAGGVATGALVLLEMRRRGRQQARSGLRSLAGDSLAGLASAPASPAPRRPEQAEGQVQEVVGGVDREEAEDRAPPPSAKPQIASASRRGRARARTGAPPSRRGAARARRSRYGGLEPAVDGEGAERVVDLSRARRRRSCRRSRRCRG